jgi:hypothetical protein
MIAMAPRRQTRLARPRPALTARPNTSPALTLWRLFEAGAWDEAGALLHPDFVAHWPQTGECFRGGENYLAVNQEHPAPGWELTVHRIVESPGCAAIQITLAHAEGIDHGACFYVVSRGRIREATELWAERSPAPAWRASWAEPEPLNDRLA